LRSQLRIPAMLPVLATKENDALSADCVTRVARQRIPASPLAEKLESAKRGEVELLASFADTLNIGYLDRYLHSL
jgi:hypothetical protein